MPYPCMLAFNRKRSNGHRELSAVIIAPSINHHGKRRAETAEKPIGFDLSLTGPETAPFRPRGQKPRVYSLGMNPYPHSPECRPVPCCLQARGVNGEIAGERE